MIKNLIISVDFDGTYVAHDFPRIGEDIGAIPILKRIVENGNKLILNTMRSYGDGEIEDTISPDIDWFYDNGIELWAVNKNPSQHKWTNSSKVFANYYIDDTALGAPLKIDLRLSRRPFIDWEAMEKILEGKGII